MVATATTAPQAAAAQAAAAPPALLGQWSGDDRAGVGSWTLEVAADGRYRMTNQRRNAQIDGTVTANGSTLLFRPSGAEPYTVTWSVDGGRLSLDGAVYLRTGGGAEGSADVLIGDWMSLEDLYKTLSLDPNGTFRLTDPTNGNYSGRFTVSGDRLTLGAGTSDATTFGWSVADGFLRLRRPDGSISEYTRGG